MDVQHDLRVLTTGVDRAVNDEARGIDLVRRLHHLLAVDVDLHQARGGDLVEQHPVGVEEEVVVGAGHSRGEVREDEIVPVVVRHQAVGGGEVHALLPLFGRDLVAEAGVGHGHSL